MSDERKETLAEISAFIRDVAQNQYEAWANDPSDAPDGRYWSEFLGKLADRIDAAAKREAATNCNRLREALESTEELLEHFAKPGSILADAFALHMRDNRAALSAPPRNCDRFDNSRDAIRAFEEEIDYIRDGGADYADLVSWLFSTAPEQEGGDK